MVHHIARPSAEVITADNVAAMTSTRLIPPYLFRVIRSRDDVGAEIVETRLIFETIHQRSPYVDDVAPLLTKRRRHDAPNRRVGLMNKPTAMNELRRVSIL